MGEDKFVIHACIYIHVGTLYMSVPVVRHVYDIHVVYSYVDPCLISYSYKHVFIHGSVP